MAKRTEAEWRERLKEVEAEGDLETANKIRSALKMEPIGTEGAPASTRAIVGASRGPGAGLAALQKFDPEARPFGPDNYLMSGNNLYNPPGLDFGDIAEWGRPVAEAGGALIGGFMGAPAGFPGIMAGAGVGGETAGTLFDYGSRLFGAEDTRSTEERLQDTATSFAFNTMGGPAPTPSGIAGNVAQDAAQDVAQNVKNEAIDLFNRGKTQMSPGQRGGRFSQAVEGWLQNSPFAAERMGQHRAGSMERFGDIVEEAAPLGSTREIAGDAITQGLTQAADTAKSRVGMAYSRLDELLDAGGGSRLDRISMDSLMKASKEFDELVERDEGFARLVYQDPDLQASIQAMKDMIANRQSNLMTGTDLPERPTYEVIKQLRTIIGRKVDDAFGTGEKLGLQRLYRILSDDLEAGVREIGGEAAVQQRQVADSLNEQMMRSLGRLDPLFKRADDPSKVYDALTTMLVNSPEKADEARMAIGANQWDRFVDTWVRRASQATPGAQQAGGGRASPATLVTNLNRLRNQSPEGYEVLMQGDRGKAMQVVEQLGEMLRDSEQFYNRSQTGGNIAMQQLSQDVVTAGALGAAGLYSGPTPAAVLALGGVAARNIIPRLTAVGMTSPSMQRALLKVGKDGRFFSNLVQQATASPSELARALIAAGADRTEVNDIFGTDEQ